MRRTRKAPRSTRSASGPAAVPTAYERATPAERAAADKIIRALRCDLAEALQRKAGERRAAGL